MSLRTRLCLAILVVVGLGFYWLVDGILREMRPRYAESMEESLVDTATLLAALVARDVTAEGIDPANLRAAFREAKSRRFQARIYDVVKTSVNLRVYVTDRRGIVVFDSDGGGEEGKDYSRWNDVARTLRGDYGARTTRVDPADLRTSVFYVAAPIRVGGETVGVLSVGKPAGSIAEFLEQARRRVIIAGLFAGLAVVALGIGITMWVTRPVRQLTAYAQQVRDGQWPPLPRLGRNEIGRLGAAFEEMRDALEGRRYVETYVQTLTHEMKSPLSAIRGAAELLEEPMPADQQARFLRNIRAETERLQNLVDRLLQLSALESRQGLRDTEELDLVGLVREVVESLRPLWAARGLTIEDRLPGEARLTGERFLLRQAVANLVQNAVEFTPPGGRVSLGMDQAPAQVVLTVSDTGPGIPDYARDRVFERFYSLPRPDSGKKSSGLGLTFVREAALRHGGDASLENLPGGGARASLRLARHPRLA